MLKRPQCASCGASRGIDAFVLRVAAWLYIGVGGTPPQALGSWLLLPRSVLFLVGQFSHQSFVLGAVEVEHCCTANS